MSGSIEVSPPLSMRVRRTLDLATSGRSTVDDRAWRIERDRLGDLLEPVVPSVLDTAEIRRIVDLISEADPSAASRMTTAEWSEEVGEVVTQLTYLG